MADFCGACKEIALYLGKKRGTNVSPVCTLTQAALTELEQQGSGTSESRSVVKSHPTCPKQVQILAILDEFASGDLSKSDIAEMLQTRAPLPGANGEMGPDVDTTTTSPSEA